MSRVRVEPSRALLDVDGPVIVLYQYDGPDGPCGQSVEATSPRCHAWGPMSYDEARTILRQLEGESGGRNSRLSVLNWAKTPERFAPASASTREDGGRND